MVLGRRARERAAFCLQRRGDAGLFRGEPVPAAAWWLWVGLHGECRKSGAPRIRVAKPPPNPAETVTRVGAPDGAAGAGHHQAVGCRD